MSDASPATVEPGAPEPGGSTGRPPALWIVVAIGVLQGLAALAAAAIILYSRSDADLIELIAQEDPRLNDRSLLVLGIAVGVVGLINTALAVMLAAGSNLVRGIYAAIATVEVAAATYGLVAVRDLRIASVVALAYPVAVIWLLYGSQRSVRFFES